MLGQAFAVCDDEAGHTLLGHLQGEVVGIEVLAFEGEEDGVLFDFATVCGDFVGFFEVLINGLDHVFLRFGPFDELRDPWLLMKEAA